MRGGACSEPVGPGIEASEDGGFCDGDCRRAVGEEVAGGTGEAALGWELGPTVQAHVGSRVLALDPIEIPFAICVPLGMVNCLMSMQIMCFSFPEMLYLWIKMA